MLNTSRRRSRQYGGLQTSIVVSCMYDHTAIDAPEPYSDQSRSYIRCSAPEAVLGGAVLRIRAASQSVAMIAATGHFRV